LLDGEIDELNQLETHSLGGQRPMRQNMMMTGPQNDSKGGAMQLLDNISSISKA